MQTVSIKPIDKARESSSLLAAIEECQLFNAEQVEQLRRKFASDDRSMLALKLVREGWLTEFQMQNILLGNGRHLVLGQYHILDELGCGGFGHVYKAHHAIMGRMVALKVISPAWVKDPQVRELFLREVKAATRLCHPNIALAHDANEINGELFFAMEYVAGPTVDQLVEKQGKLPIPFACAVMRQTAQALQHAHELGMVHRDIKPPNLILPGACFTEQHSTTPNFGPLVKVVDFGLARLYPAEAGLACTIRDEGTTMGTPAFMSPEQARNIHEVDIRSDLYSLGCTFYYALAGKLPFEASGAHETIAMHLASDPPPLSLVRPDTPPEVIAIIRKLMEKDPNRRFQTPADLLQALAMFWTSQWQRTAVRRDDKPAPAAAETHPKITDTTVTPQTPSSAHSPARLQELWRAWCSVIELLVRGEVAVLNDRDYRALHRALLHEIHPAVKDSSIKADWPRRLETLVEPWMNLHSFADLDRKSLLGMWKTCRELDGEFVPQASRSTMIGAWLFIGLMIASLLAGARFLFQ